MEGNMLNVWRLACRNFSSGNVWCRQAQNHSKFLGKILRKSCENTNPYAIPVLRPGITNFIRPDQTQKRIKAMTKVLTGHITDLLSTGSVAPQVVEKNIEICGIEVAQNLNVIRVYWAHSDMYVDKELEEIVMRAGHALRYELCRLNVVGNVPPVLFVKNKFAFDEVELERRFETADYGEDFVPQTYKAAILETVTNVEASEEEDTTKGDFVKKEAMESKEKGEGEFSVSLPAMRHDVLGLDHYTIMTKIKVALEKSRKSAERRKMLPEISNNDFNYPDISAAMEEQVEQQQKFLDYLKTAQRKKWVKEKMMRSTKQFAPVNTEEEMNEEEVEDEEDMPQEVYIEDDFEEDYEDDFEDREK